MDKKLYTLKENRLVAAGTYRLVLSGPGPVEENCTGFVTSAKVHGTGVLKPMTETESGALMSFVDGGGNHERWNSVQWESW